MVLFDAGYLMALLDPNAKLSVARGRDRVNYLFDDLSKANEIVVVPTPALSELLVHANAAGPEYLRILSNSSRFRISSFDTKAAVEGAAMLRDAIEAGDKRSGLPDTISWQKIKFDRQIIAIAKVTGCSTIYADDRDIQTLVGLNGPPVIDFANLPLPPESAQYDFHFGQLPEPEDDEAI